MPERRLLVRLVQEELRRAKARPELAAKLRELRNAVRDLDTADTRERVLLAEILRWYGERGQAEAKKFAKVDPEAKLRAALDDARRFLDGF